MHIDMGACQNQTVLFTYILHRLGRDLNTYILHRLGRDLNRYHDNASILVVAIEPEKDMVESLLVTSSTQCDSLRNNKVRDKRNVFILEV